MSGSWAPTQHCVKMSHRIDRLSCALTVSKGQPGDRQSLCADRSVSRNLAKCRVNTYVSASTSTGNPGSVLTRIFDDEDEGCFVLDDEVAGGASSAEEVTSIGLRRNEIRTDLASETSDELAMYGHVSQ